MDLKDFQELFEQSSAVKIVVDTNFAIVTASDAFLKVTGTTREDITGLNIFEVFPDYIQDEDAEQAGDMLASFKRVLQHKSTETLPVIQYDLPKSDSERGGYDVKYWRPVNTPVLDQHKNVKYIIQRSEDVTEQVLAQERSEGSNKRYYKMLMNSPFAVAVMKGKEMVVTLANDLIKDFWGKGRDIEGKSLLEILPEIKDQAFPEILDKVYTTGIPFYSNEILARLRYNGKLEDRYFNVVYQPFREADETISGITAIAYDVTEMVIARNKAEESEYRYRTLIEGSTVATALYKGPDMILQYANDNMLKVWGKDQSVIGKSLIEALPELKGQNFLQILQNVYKTGITYTGVEEKANLVVNGKLETFFFNYTFSALHDKKGKIYGILNTAIDVTKEVLAKKALQESEETLRQLLNSMPQKISHTDEDGNVIFFNQQWVNETGYKPEELKGKRWIKTVHPDDFQRIKENWIKAVKLGSAFEVECRIWHKDLGYRWNLNRAVPIKDENGDLIMWVGTNTDIHEQKKQKEILEKAVSERTKELKQANQELIIQNREKEEQKKELLTANKELESFAYISSHDLQEPLRKIQTFASRIREIENQNLSEKGRDYFERMQDAAKRMRILIDDLLSFSRVNNHENNIEKIDLNEIVEGVKEDFKEVIEKKNATIEVTELCDANIIVFQFRQLMNNLISNALKFSKPGRPPHIVIMSKTVKGSETGNKLLSQDHDYCHIKVSDNGIGFDPRYTERIFEVFQRLHNREEYAGTGIGLAIVKKIVDNHDGIITATSEPGKGSTFDIYIPVL